MQLIRDVKWDEELKKDERLHKAIADLQSKPLSSYADTYDYLHAAGYDTNGSKGRALGFTTNMPMQNYVPNLGNQFRFFKTIDPSFKKLPAPESRMRGKHIKAIFADPHNTDDGSAFMRKINYKDNINSMTNDRAINRTTEHNMYAAFGHDPELSKHLPENKYYPNKKPFSHDNYRNLGGNGLFEAVMKGLPIENPLTNVPPAENPSDRSQPKDPK